MSDDTILSLALQAIDDADAQEVLVDALLERGPNVDVEESFATIPPSVRVTVDGSSFELDLTRELAKGSSQGVSARALAAVLLFRNWPTRWPLAEANANALTRAIATRRARDLLEAQIARGFTRESLLALLHASLQRHGYGNAEIELTDSVFGHIRAHIVAPVPDTVLASIEGDLLPHVPIYLLVEVTAMGDPRDDYGFDVDGALGLRTTG
jgi:hypothetical protein